MLVIGGKTGTVPMESEYTNSVYGFSMKETLEGKPTTEEWKPLTGMKENRANFMAVVIDNKVYVYGGIQGKSTEASEKHCPTMN